MTKSVNKKEESVSREPGIELLEKDEIIRRLREELNQEIKERKKAEAVSLREKKLIKLIQLITTASNEATSADFALQEALNNICSFMEWPMGNVYLYQKENGKLIPGDIWHYKSKQGFKGLKQAIEKLHFKPDSGIPGRAYKSKFSVQTDTMPAEYKQIAVRLSLKSCFAFPVFIESDVAAVLQFFSYNSSAEIPEDFIESINVIATQLGRVLEREKAKNEIDALNDSLEIKIKRRTASLEQSNKELEAFSYSVSHDLRAPLRAIEGFARILEEENRDSLSEEGNRVLNIITKNTRKMSHLIDDLLSFSRVGRKALNCINVDIAALSKSVCIELQQVEKNRKIEFITKTMPKVYVDKSMIKIVLNNLLSNAIKYTRPREMAKVEMGSMERNGEVVYYIKDNGVGFDMRYKDKLFGVFQRLHSEEEFEGTGVGLTIVNRIILRHNGRIWAESELNKGTVFYFSLPN